MNLLLRKKEKAKLILQVFLVGIFLLTLSVPVSFAEVGIDIRSDGVLIDGYDTASYAASINDCSDLISLSVIAGDENKTFSPSETSRINGSSTGCELKFSGTGVGRYDPEITLNFSDGTTQTHAESFSIEKTVPQLIFEGVSFSFIDGHQYLAVTANATDDVDISYVGFSVVGIRASDLRAAGGVVAHAKKNAFAATEGTVRVYPISDGQEIFLLPLKVTSELDAEAIAHDGVVLVDIIAVDASGNQNTFSKISFTGSDVVESVSDLQAQPSRIIFTNLLETATIIPSVNFQFRGQTPLPGLGSGASYESSHPDLIAVTAGGIVYPLSETSGENVTITVSYPDLEPVVIPVEVDLSKYLVSLKVEGVNGEGNWILDRLNTYFPFPNIVGVFDDTSEAEISSQFEIEYLFDANATGIFDLDEKNGLMAKAIVPDSTPVMLTVRLLHHPEIFTTIPVIALDAIPDIELELPSQVKAGSNLVLSANATDDVGISEVRFLMDGAVIGIHDVPPYPGLFINKGRDTHKYLLYNKNCRISCYNKAWRSRP